MSDEHRTTSAVLQTVLMLTVMYVGVPLLFHLFPGETGVLASETTNAATSATTNMASQPVQTPPLSFSNIGSVIRFALLGILQGIGLLFQLPKLLFLPLRQAYYILASVLKVLVRLFYPILAPFIYGMQFLVAFILLPFILLQQAASAMYPLYVFFGAACTCGAILGLLARSTNSFVLSNVFGIGGKSQRQLLPQAAVDSHDVGLRKRRGQTSRASFK